MCKHVKTPSTDSFVKSDVIRKDASLPPPLQQLLRYRQQLPQLRLLVKD